MIIERSHLETLGIIKISDMGSSEEQPGIDPIVHVDDQRDAEGTSKERPNSERSKDCENSIEKTPTSPLSINITKEKMIPGTDLSPTSSRVELVGISSSVSEIMKYRNKPISKLKRPSGPSGRPRPLAAEYDGELKLINDNVSCMGGQGKIEDFRKLFMDRFRSLKEMLVRQYGALEPCLDISDLRGSEDIVCFVGIVESVRTTKNGHTMIMLEDPTSTIRVLVSKKKRDLHSIRLVNDEVVGIIGKYKAGDNRGGAIVFADSILKVDIPGTHRRRLSEVKGLTAAFTSDIHIGSKMYLEKDWNKMVKWLRGERDASLPAKDGSRVKYLVVAGDLVDGIGTYPDQDKDLLIKDIFKQYEALGESLSLLPDHIEVVLIPGNHDAVRLAEPQPPLPKEYQECFSNSHIHFLPNPSFFSIHGVHVAGYHGKSIDDLVTLFKDVSYEDPIEGMKEMLRFRHFSPAYGMRNQISPEERDMLIIEDIPDIFVSGHVHRFGLDNYKGIQLIEGSTWQSQTPFQKMMNLKPQPGRMGVVELDLPDSMHGWELT
jgi:DNA polymerase II small subunit